MQRQHFADVDFLGSAAMAGLGTIDAEIDVPRALVTLDPTPRDERIGQGASLDFLADGVDCA